MDGYTERGGVTGSLSRRAEEIYDGLSETAQHAAREVFLRLVAVAEDGDDTRRRVRRAELESLGLGEASLDAVLDGFGSFRLLSFDHDPITRGPTVEVAHEALIREWPRFRSWVDERREDLVLERRLAAASVEWDEGGRDPSFLFAGGQLEQYEQWARTADVRLTTEEREFLALSREADDGERRHRRRRRNLVASALSVLSVLALIAAGLALQQRNDANDEAARAEAARAEAETAAASEGVARESAEAAAAAERGALADAIVKQRIAESARLADRQPSLSMLIAREVYERAPGPDTLGALLTSMQRTDGYLGHVAIRESSSNDQWIGALDGETVVVRTPTTIDVYDLSTRSLVSTTPSPAFLGGVATSGAVGGGRFATVDGDGTLRVIDQGETEPHPRAGLGPGDEEQESFTAVSVGGDGSLVVGRIEPGSEAPFTAVVVTPDDDVVSTLTGIPHPVLATALSPDGRHAATQDQWGNITLWDVSSAEPLWSWTPGDRSRWKPDDEPIELATGADGTPLEIGLVDGGPRPLPAGSEPAGVPGVVGELRFSSDGTSLYSLVSGLIAFDVETGARRWQRLWSGAKFQLAEDRDGRLIHGNEIVEDGEVVGRLAGVGASARVAITPDGTRRISIEPDGIKIWSTDADQLLAHGVPRGDANVATLNPDGSVVAAFNLSDPGDRAIRDVETARALDLPGEPAWVLFTTTGELLEYSRQRVLSLRDPETGELLGPPLEPQRWAGVAVDPLGRFVAVGRLDSDEIGIYDIATGLLVETLLFPVPAAAMPGRDGGRERDPGVYWIDVSPDGGLIAASNTVGVTIWETSSWSEAGTVDSPDGDEFTDIAFSPDGERLALVSELGVVATHELATGRTSAVASGAVPVAGVNNVNSIEYGRDGSTIVTAGTGVAIVDVATGSLVGTPFPSQAVDSASIAGDGMSVVTGTDDHLLVWDLDPTSWADLACHAAGRNMTQDEWQQYGWIDEPYRPTCPQWEAGA
jgi:WD40 repeat protein